MSGDATTIARPYAEAIFARADETGKLDEWSEQLEFLDLAVKQPELAGIISNPLVDKGELTNLLFDISEQQVGDEARNLLKLLVENKRLSVIPEISELFAKLKAEKDSLLNVLVKSAYVLKPAQVKQLEQTLETKLGRKITITSEKDPDLIGGIHIRAGDLVIDGSVRGQLVNLAHELGI
jgi:F-type H+-transporting ATPase subunit delta